MSNESNHLPNPSEQELATFEKYISTRKILIVDEAQSARSSISKVLTQLGAKTASVGLASNYNEAIEQIHSLKPEILITDYNLQKHCGIELASVFRDSLPNPALGLFIICTGNSSESAIAEAAEEDVDSFILKPFSVVTLKYYLVRAAAAKMAPTQYQETIQQGKNLLSTDQLDVALQVFDSATGLIEKPTLAYYYKGLILEKKKQIGGAEGEFRKGLSFNPIHYRCSIGLFDNLVKKGDNGEAYSTIKTVFKKFPISPQRLCKAIDLAVRTHNFDDVTMYHDLFKNLDERREDLCKHVCAALVVGGLYQERKGNKEAALDLFNKAAVTAAGNPVTLHEVVMILVRNKLPDYAPIFLKRFPADQLSSQEYQSAEYSVLDLTGNAEDLVNIGRKLVKSGVQNSTIYYILIKRTYELKYVDAADQLILEATRLFPNSKEEFLALKKAQDQAA